MRSSVHQLSDFPLLSLSVLKLRRREQAYLLLSVEAIDELFWFGKNLNKPM